MSKKNSSKRIRFNYFVPSLVDITDNNANIRWNMKEFFEFILNHEHNDLNTAVPLGDEIAEMGQSVIDREDEIQKLVDTETNLR